MSNTPTIVLYEAPFLQNYLHTVLEREGFHVIACSPARVIQMVRSPKKTIDMVITNSPLEFHSVRSDLPLLYMSVYPNPDVPGLFAKCLVLAKPFRAEELLSAVRELTAPM